MTRCLPLSQLLGLKKIADSTATDVEALKKTSSATKAEVDSTEETAYATLAGVTLLLLGLAYKFLRDCRRPASSPSPVNTSSNVTYHATPSNDGDGAIERVFIVDRETDTRPERVINPPLAIEGTQPVRDQAGRPTHPTISSTPPLITSARFIRGVMLNSART